MKLEECVIDGCTNLQVNSRGWCDKHYHRWIKHGDPNKTLLNIGVPKEQRFWMKVNKSNSLEECWLWAGSIDKKGYGKFANSTAHRYSYALAGNNIPDGYEVDHKCWNPPCVNPTHLQAVPPKKNNENRKGPNHNTSSGYLNVHWWAKDNRWVVIVNDYNSRYYGGSFTDKEEANKAAIRLRNNIFTNNLKDRGE